MSGTWRERARARILTNPRKPDRGIRARVRNMRKQFVFNRELRLRMLSAAILIPVVLVSTWFGELTFLAIVLITGALVLYEWLRMIGAGHLFHLRVVGWASLAIVAVIAQTQPLAVAAAAVMVAALACALAAWKNRVDIAARWVALGTIYAGLAVVALVALRKGPDGFGAVVFVFLIAWASDTMAFFVGRKVGGPKLWPRVSPSKTWSGALGGFVAGVVFGAAVAQFLGVPVTAGTLVAAAFVAIAAQVGDLVESAAKRRFSIKDAGNLIPGHGGVMDRVDGVAAASLVCVGLGAMMASDTPAAGLLSFMAAGE